METLLIIIVIGIILIVVSKNFNKPKKQTRYSSLNNLRAETQKLKEENLKWEKVNYPIADMNNKGIQYEKSGMIERAILEYEKCMVHMYNHIGGEYLNSFAMHSPDRLRILYKKEKHPKEKIFLKEFIDFCNKHSIKYPEIFERQLNNTKKDIIKPDLNLRQSDIQKQYPNHPTIGQKLHDIKSKMPEFHFYYDMPEDMQTFEYLWDKNPVSSKMSEAVGNAKEEFVFLLDEAKQAERNGDFKIAIELNQKLIIEGFEDKTPYERLMIIYRKHKWKEEEIKIIEQGINFFTELKEKQKIYILALAKKYNMESKAWEYINSGKKIQYFAGAYDLYNPFTFLNKWKDRLQKLK